MIDKGEANVPYLRTKGGLVCIARDCLPRTSPGRENLTFNSIILSRSLIVSLRFGDTVTAKVPTLSDVFKGNRVAILLR